MPVAQRLGWGRTHCDPLLLGEAHTKLHTVAPSYPPAQNTYRGTPSLPYPTTPLTLRSPKPNYGQVTPTGPTLGCAFCTRILGPMQVTPNKRKLGGGAISGNSPFGPLGVTCPFFSFGLLSISGTPGPHSHY